MKFVVIAMLVCGSSACASRLSVVSGEGSVWSAADRSGAECRTHRAASLRLSGP